jgi:hypothetical protein
MDAEATLASTSATEVGMSMVGGLLVHRSAGVPYKPFADMRMRKEGVNCPRDGVARRPTTLTALQDQCTLHRTHAGLLSS